MITYSGIHIQKIGGADGTPTARDCAVQAGRICRYAGAIWAPLLTHSVFTGLLLYKRTGSIRYAVAGFLHDLHEVASGETPRPFKCDCIRREQAALDERIFSRFLDADDLEPIDAAVVKQADIDAGDIEAVYLCLPNYENLQGEIRPLYTNMVDIRLFRDLCASPFYNGTISPHNRGVQVFTQWLKLAEQREWSALKDNIENWRRALYED